MSRSAILLCPLINPFAGELAGCPRSTVLSCHPCHVAGHVFVITRVTGDAPQAPVRQRSHGSLQYSPPGKPRHGGPCDWPRPVSREGLAPGLRPSLAAGSGPSSAQPPSRPAAGPSRPLGTAGGFILCLHPRETEARGRAWLFPCLMYTGGWSPAQSSLSGLKIPTQNASGPRGNN